MRNTVTPPFFPCNSRWRSYGDPGAFKRMPCLAQVWAKICCGSGFRRSQLRRRIEARRRTSSPPAPGHSRTVNLLESSTNSKMLRARWHFCHPGCPLFPATPAGNWRRAKSPVPSIGEIKFCRTCISKQGFETLRSPRLRPFPRHWNSREPLQRQRPFDLPATKATLLSSLAGDRGGWQKHARERKLSCTFAGPPSIGKRLTSLTSR